jgi:hypothetical protein
LTWLIATIMTFFARVDAGVVFCRRADFVTVGGYDESLEYAEDIKILVELKRLATESIRSMGTGCKHHAGVRS